MNDKSLSSLCRICLSSGATIPLFEGTSTTEVTHYKLSSCVSEKVENIEGYPHNICTSCNTTLLLVFTFINKYKQTQILLQNSLKKVKKECYDIVKIEKEDVISDSDVDDALPLIDIKTKEESSKNNSSIHTKVQRGCKTNKTASKFKKNAVDIKKQSMKIGNTSIKKIVNKKTEIKNTKKHSVIQKPETKRKKGEAKNVAHHLCDHCGETFKRRQLLRIHKDRAHTAVPLKCSECPSVFNSSIQLYQHGKRNHSLLPKTHICPTCGKAYSYKGLLQTHIKRVHNRHLLPKQTFVCQYCDKVYKAPQSKIIHERSVHTGERPAECSVCDKKFFHIIYLRQHMMLHTGETPFKCPICGRGYNQNGNMKSHLRNHRKSEIDPDILSKLRPSLLKRLKP